MRHRNPHHGVQDLLPEVIGRPVLRVDLVVEREPPKELLDGEKQIPLVVVILELREHETMAEPRERTQEDCGRERHGCPARPQLRGRRDAFHPASLWTGLWSDRRRDRGTATASRKPVRRPPKAVRASHNFS